MTEALDAWAAAQGDKPERPEAIRRLLAEVLTAKGYLRPACGDSEIAN